MSLGEKIFNKADKIIGWLILLLILYLIIASGNLYVLGAFTIYVVFAFIGFAIELYDNIKFKRKLKELLPEIEKFDISHYETTYESLLNNCDQTFKEISDLARYQLLLRFSFPIDKSLIHLIFAPYKSHYYKLKNKSDENITIR